MWLLLLRHTLLHHAAAAAAATAVHSVRVNHDLTPFHKRETAQTSCNKCVSCYCIVMFNCL